MSIPIKAKETGKLPLGYNNITIEETIGKYNDKLNKSHGGNDYQRPRINKSIDYGGF